MHDILFRILPVKNLNTMCPFSSASFMLFHLFTKIFWIVLTKCGKVQRVGIFL